MKPNVVLLTSDQELERTVRCSADLGGYDLVIGRSPPDGPRLLSKNIAELRAVIVDLDVCEHGAAWLGAISSLPQRVSAVAVTRLDRRFLEPIAKMHGVNHWLCKPLTAFRFASEIKSLCEQSSERQ